MPETTGDLRCARFDHADLTGASFHRVQLNDARFRLVDLSGAVMRGVALAGAAIDGELAELDGLTINGVEIVPLIEAELTRRQPARALLTSDDPADLLAALALVERSWESTNLRVSSMPAGTVDISIEGEWSLRETLRHLVFVTDAWLGAVRGDARPFHPWGVPFTDLGEFIPDSVDLGLDPAANPSLEQVSELRAERSTRLRETIAAADPPFLASEVTGPVWDREPVTVLRCLRVILREECEHQRFAERDLDLIAARSAS